MYVFAYGTRYRLADARVLSKKECRPLFGAAARDRVDVTRREAFLPWLRDNGHDAAYVYFEDLPDLEYAQLAQDFHKHWLIDNTINQERRYPVVDTDRPPGYVEFDDASGGPDGGDPRLKPTDTPLLNKIQRQRARARS